MSNQNQIIVSKFGGTSMGTKEAMLHSAQISIRQNSFIVVVSATSGTTNDLIRLAQAAQTLPWNEVQLHVEKIKTRHFKLADELSVGEATVKALNVLTEELESLAHGINLLKDCSVKAMDTMMAFGERMSSLLFAQALQKIAPQKEIVLLDARRIIKTDDQFGKARPFFDKIKENCTDEIKITANKIYVTQGFIGSTLDNSTTTLSRGGSDYSAALFAEGVNANILEIWTDVPGIATTDPRICPNAKPIKEITYKEASEMATFGAKILHPATLLPAIRNNIPVFVGSTFDSNQLGTWVKRSVEDMPLVRALAIRNRQSLVTLSTPEMLYAHGFLYQIFKVFNENKVSIDTITTSEISVALTLDDSTLLNKKLLDELEQFADVQVENELSLISLIGNNINYNKGLAKNIFNEIEDINVRMVSSGASKHNFCFLVAESHGPEVIKRLHKKFIELT